MIQIVDIGGSNTRVAISDGKKILQKQKINTDVNNPKKVLDWIIKIAKENKIFKIGLAVPGPLNLSKGIVLNPANLPGWHNFNIKEYLSNNYEFIYINSDSKLMGFANHFASNGTEKDVTLFYTLSSGIGSAVIMNNQIYFGFNGNSTEIAKDPSSKEKGEKNKIGEYALEFFSGGNSLQERAKELGIANSTKELFIKYKLDSKAKKLIDLSIDALSTSIAGAISYLNPSKIIFDGAISRNNKWYIDKIIRKTKAFVSEAQWNVIDFSISKYGDDAVLIGLQKVMKGC